ncbi:DHA2 family efflux MFS transporter permease subunit [Marinobacter sp. BGYM27]|uniref:DHA2 family efflux MFS transporter permease subunit n=1 Tax=Marinobacter sp. BGYM27 TaxID=2975597 RepID=UPI0021A8872C|nr:DHA2 family efflux MFS transporter permease subunit [Marinobacter sp. BGYM27]MDG5501386.1 DHA2 family efflux MFS transporter permease subunit [Marinobacter sp. BGYM27]|tara:strand:+ start:7409 stop:8929 length:1521 start_codon:yes stop_codon:yes gene_type:complete
MTAIATKAPRSAKNLRGLITLSIMLATIMQALDTTIANVALPHMQGSMSATSEQISWVLTSYIVAAAIATPLTGFLAARIGRRQLFLLSVTGFTIASVLCGIATNLNELVAFRLLQGIFGAGLVPLSQAVLLDTYPKEQHGSAMAMWGVGVMIGPILGPTLGGYLTEVLDWRWVFFINLPVGILSLLGIWAFVPETEKDKRSFDVFGFTLLAIAIGALQLMLDRGQSQDWFASTEIMLETALAGTALAMFLVHMMTARAPFLEPGLFRDRNLSVGLVFIFMVGIILLATLALLPPFLQQLMGYPVMTTGFALAPRGLGSMIAMMLVGRLVNRVDIRALVFLGLTLVSVSLFQMAEFTTDVSMATLVGTGIIQGLGLGFIFVPLSTISFATLAPRYRNEATAMFSLMRNIGSSIGISVMVTLVARNTQINHAVLGEFLNPFRPAFEAMTLPGGIPTDSATGMALLDQTLNAQAATISYLNDFRLMAWVTVASMPLLFLFRSQSKSAP